MGQFVNRHPSRDGYRRHLGNLDRSLADNVAAQDLVSLAVGEQFAKAEGATVDNRARRRVEASNRSADIVCFTSLRFRRAGLRLSVGTPWKCLNRPFEASPLYLANYGTKFQRDSKESASKRWRKIFGNAIP